MFRISFISLILIAALTVTSCSGQNAASDERDYEETKKMVVDILQTDDGKQALRDILSEESMKKQLVMDSDELQQSVEDMLTSEDAAKMWKSLFNDPSFVKTYAKSMAEEHKKLMKDLMKDADVQQQMLDLMKDPQMTEKLLNVLKSQEFNEHLEDAIENTMETPMFQKKINDILLKAAKEQQSNNEDKEQGKDENSDESEGGA